MKSHIEAAIANHTTEAERLVRAKNEAVDRLKTSGSFDADQLLAYGNQIKGFDNELREHTRTLDTLNHLIKFA